MVDENEEQPISTEPLPEPLLEETPRPVEEERAGEDMSDLFDMPKKDDLSDMFEVTEEDIQGAVDEGEDESEANLDDLFEVTQEDIMGPAPAGPKPKPRYKTVHRPTRREPPPSSLGGVRS